MRRAEGVWAGHCGGSERVAMKESRAPQTDQSAFVLEAIKKAAEASLERRMKEVERRYAAEASNNNTGARRARLVAEASLILAANKPPHEHLKRVGKDRKYKPVPKSAPPLPKAGAIQSVYIIGSLDGPYKVGIAADVRDRLKALQTSNASQLVIHYEERFGPGVARKIERAAHQALAEHRMSGEWFSADLETIKRTVSLIALSL